MRIVNVFRDLLFQGLDTLTQLCDQFISLCHLFSQHPIFGSKLEQFFFWLRALYFTHLSALLQVGKRPE